MKILLVAIVLLGVVSAQQTQVNFVGLPRVTMERDVLRNTPTHLLNAMSSAIGSVSYPVPAEWNLVGPCDPHATLKLTFAVKQQNLDQLKDLLHRVSDPDSAQYGQHLSYQQVQDLVTPQESHVKVLAEFFEQSGVPSSAVEWNNNQDFAQITLTTQQANTLLAANFQRFSHAPSGTSVCRCVGGYSLPDAVAHVVDFVGGTIRFPRMPNRPSQLRPNTVRAGDDEEEEEPAQNLGVTPDFLRKLYNIGDFKPSASGNAQCVAQFLEQYYSPSDLQSFFSQYYPAAKGQKVTRVVGDNVESNPGIEASLDIEYIMAVSGGTVDTWFWYTAGRHENQEPFLEWLMKISQTENPPQVFSVSYGDDEKSISKDYAHRVSAEVQKLGASGISILFASGDGGVAGSQPQMCDEFIPTFPAAVPYVTSVGGTRSSSPEVVNSLSGGGFSNYFDRPDYQKDAVDNYLATASNLPAKNLFNESGRAFPDVAAQSSNFDIVYSGFSTPVSGTSAACPTFAAVVALLNDARLQAGKAPLGFLNPWLYKVAASDPDAFNDITDGSNPGCGSDGFYANKGWDAATGLGTPNFQRLAKHL